MFFGIVVRIYFAPKKHNPPHVHVYYQDDTASFSIETGELLNGNFLLNKPEWFKHGWRFTKRNYLRIGNYVRTKNSLLK